MLGIYLGNHQFPRPLTRSFITTNGSDDVVPGRYNTMIIDIVLSILVQPFHQVISLHFFRHFWIYPMAIEQNASSIGINTFMWKLIASTQFLLPISLQGVRSECHHHCRYDSSSKLSINFSSPHPQT